jgi:hypothetical protein
MNAELRDALLAAFPLNAAGLSAAWTSYTPTLTQSATVTKTVTYAKYMKIGRLVIVNLLLAVTGAGTAANAVLVGLPVTAATGDGSIGAGYIYDASVSTIYNGVADLASTTTADLLAPATGGGLGAFGFTAALAASDAVSLSAMYEAAT